MPIRLMAGDGKTHFELKDGSFAASIGGLAGVKATTYWCVTRVRLRRWADTVLAVGSTVYTFDEALRQTRWNLKRRDFPPPLFDFLWTKAILVSENRY
jgi:hypothetical protein